MPGGEGGGPSVGPIPRKKGGREQFPRRYSRHVFGPCSGQGAPSARQPQDARGEAEKQRWVQPNTERALPIFATGTWSKRLTTNHGHTYMENSGWSEEMLCPKMVEFKGRNEKTSW